MVHLGRKWSSISFRIIERKDVEREMDQGEKQSVISDNSQTVVPNSLLIVYDIVIKRATAGEGIQES